MLPCAVCVNVQFKYLERKGLTGFDWSFCRDLNFTLMPFITQTLQHRLMDMTQQVLETRIPNRIEMSINWQLNHPKAKPTQDSHHRWTLDVKKLLYKQCWNCFSYFKKQTEQFWLADCIPQKRVHSQYLQDCRELRRCPVPSLES